MEENKTYRVPSRTEPGYWNRDLAVGLAAGGLIFTATGMVNNAIAAVSSGLGGVTFALAIAGLAASVAAPFIGAYKGNERLKNEREHGKEVAPPTLLNKTSVIGAWLGALAGAIPSMAAAAMSGNSLVGLAVESAVIAAGGMIGGSMGKERLTREYEEAKTYHAQLESLTKALGKQPEYTVSPELAAELEARLQAGREKGKVEALSISRTSISAVPAVTG